MPFSPTTQAATTNPPLKWVGGKRQLRARILSEFPENFVDYFEPFVGSGAIALNVQGSHQVQVSDLNADLILFWRMLQTQPCELISELKKIAEKMKAGVTCFQFVKDSFNAHETSGVFRAAEFVTLVRLGHSGIWRVNKAGIFNVPSANYKSPDIVQEALMQRTSELIQDWKISVCSYAEIQTTKGDLVYLDPPYHSLPDARSFTSYTSQGFSDKDQIVLRDWCVELNDRGVQFVQSNSDCEAIRDLYREFKIIRVDRKGTLNIDSSDRGRVCEVLIKNF